MGVEAGVGGGDEAAGPPGGVAPVGSGLENSGLEGSGDGSDGADGVDGSAELGGVDRSGGAAGLVAGGGAIGGVGDSGPPEDRSSGTATRAATAHVSPAPAAARSSRRRAAPRRIAS